MNHRDYCCSKGNINISVTNSNENIILSNLKCPNCNKIRLYYNSYSPNTNIQLNN